MKGFNYDKFKSESGDGNSWGSYSDLFMVLSFVFLMMYVVSSLRSGTSSVHQRLEKQKVARENADLKAQIKAYNTLKDSALQEESKDEQEVYNELMDKLSLLQEEAKEEKQKLRREAKENEKKEIALNKYQQVVRNIIDANILAKSKLKVREEIIETKNVTISDLNQQVEEKKKQIEKNNRQIAQIENELAKNIEGLKKAEKTSKLTKAKALQQIAKLKIESQQKIKKLAEVNNKVESQLAQITQELSKTSEQLEKTETELASTSEKLKQTEIEYQEQIEQIQNAHQAKMAQEKQAFEKKIQSANLTAKQKAEQLEEFNRQVKAKDQAMNQKIASLKEELTETQDREMAKAREAQQLATELAQTSEKLEQTVGDYEGQIKQMQDSHAAKMAQEKAAFNKKLASANVSAQEKARQLEEFNRQAQAKDQAMNQQLASLQGELSETQKREAAKGKEAQKLASELAQTSQKLEKTVGDYEGQIKQMGDAHAAKMAGDKAAFEGKLKAAKLSAEEKARQLADFNRQAAEKDAALKGQIAGLKGDLAAAQERANARAKLAKDIAKALREAGVDADVNPGTGDVFISFGKDYFDSGSAELKPSMSSVLKKFIPKYSDTLFKDPKIASKITSVELVGFASPTYQGRYIDPQSLSPEDQKAAKYNLDLSYQRARAIFDYMFDTKKINYQNQRDLLPLVKVTGRSFFTEGRAPSGVSPGMSQKEFCQKVDCKQAQKVIIKFNMDDKK